MQDDLHRMEQETAALEAQFQSKALQLAELKQSKTAHPEAELLKVRAALLSA